MTYLTRPMSLAERRAGVLGVVQLVILAVLVGTVPVVGIPTALVWGLLHLNVRLAKSKRVAELEREYYPFPKDSRLFYSDTRPTTGKAGDVWVNPARGNETLTHDGEDYR